MKSLPRLCAPSRPGASPTAPSQFSKLRSRASQIKNFERAWQHPCPLPKFFYRRITTTPVQAVRTPCCCPTSEASTTPLLAGPQCRGEKARARTPCADHRHQPGMDDTDTYRQSHRFAGSDLHRQDRDGRGQPAPGHFHRHTIRTAASPSSTSSRRATWAHEAVVYPNTAAAGVRPTPHGGSARRSPARRRPGPHHPHPGAHDRDDQQAHRVRSSSVETDAGRRTRSPTKSSSPSSVCAPC